MTIRHIIIALPSLLLGWLGVLVAVGVLTDAAPASVVVFPSAHFKANLPQDVAILSENGLSVTLASEQPGFARRLYAQGAWLVLPAGLAGCLPLGVRP